MNLATRLLLIGSLLSHALFSQKNTPAKTIALIKDQAISNLQQQADTYKKIALSIWDFAEVGYKEVKSSTLLQQTLKDNGFTLETGVAEIPTAFVASYGSGKPVIGILAEFDAL